MLIIRTAIAYPLLMIAVLLTGLVTSASGAGTTLTARANVLPWATLQAEKHVAEYTITDEDIARGHVIVHTAATLYITTNASRQITIRPVATGTNKVYLAGAGGQSESSLVINIDAGPSIRHIQRSLDYRINLQPDSRQGRYQLDTYLDIVSL